MFKKRFKEKNHPYTNDALGLPLNIKSFSRKEAIDWKKRFYQPANMVLSIAGNFSEAKIIPLIEKFFGEKEKREPVKEPKFKPGGYSNFFIHNHRIDREQIRFLLSFPAFGWKEIPRQKRSTIGFLGEILARGPVSRLAKLLREEKSLVYWVRSQVALFPWRGELLISGSTASENSAKVMKLIYSEIKKLLEKGFSKTELVRAKNILNSNTSFRFESPESIAYYFAGEEFWQEGIWLPGDYIAAGNKITKQELNKLAKIIFDFSKVNIGLMGNLKNEEVKTIMSVFKNS